jgi:hypothetical protein
MSQRLSDASLSYDHHSSSGHGAGAGMSTRMNNSGSMQSFSSATPLGPGNQRFGPTANIRPGSPAMGPGGPNGRAPGAGAGAAGAAGGMGGTAAMMDDDDLDDALHTFTAKDRKDLSTPFDITSMRGWANALTLCFLLAAIVALFGAYPIIAAALNNQLGFGANTAGYNLGGINATGQYPDVGIPPLIDPDTPDGARTKTGYDGEQWDLVFSDEFNQDGRTFYPGDDPFWEAVDIHYWPTG